MEDPELLRGLYDDPPRQLSMFESKETLQSLRELLPGDRALIVFLAKSAVEARQTYAIWAFSENHREASELFARAADREQKHAELCRWFLSEDPSSGSSSAMHEFVRNRETTRDRLAAGAVARPLVTGRACVGIREFYRETDLIEALDRIEANLRTLQREGREILGQVCESDEEREAAETTVMETVQVAHGTLTEVLEQGEL